MINRRDFFRATAGAALGGLFVTGSGCARTATVTGTGNATGRDELQRIGVQLYTVRDLLRDDFEGTLRRVADIGYKEFEFAGLYDRTPQQVRSLLNELQVSAPSAHVGFDRVRDHLDEILAEAEVMGYRYIIVPSLPNDIRGSIDGYKTVAEVLNTAGARTDPEGIRIGYHNHAFEFEEMDGQIPYNILLEETDPDLVDMEMDLYWIRRGGHNPVTYFEQYPGRFALSHVKDMTSDGEMAPVGQGTMDFAEIFSRSEQAGMRHYIVEHDNPQDAIQSITISYQYLDNLRF